MTDITDMESLKRSIKTSFDKVKDDFMRHNLKIAVLERENIFLRREIEQLSNKVKELSESTEAREAIDHEQIFSEESPIFPLKSTSFEETGSEKIPQETAISSKNTVLSDTAALERIFDKKIKEILSQVPQETKGSQKSQTMRQERQIPVLNNETGLESEFLRKLRQNKRDIIKQRVLEAIQSKKLTTLELKDLMVDKNNYCSKATFYRYLKELRKEIPLGSIPDGDRSILVAIPRK